MLHFNFEIDKSTGRPTVREAMAYDSDTKDKIWIKFEHDVTKGTFKAEAPKYPSLKVSGSDFQECCVNFQKAYAEMVAGSKNDS